MLKKITVFLLLFILLYQFSDIKINGYDEGNYYNQFDFGDYDSYTNTDYGYNNLYSIIDYDVDTNCLFGQNSDFSSFISHEYRYEKGINIYDDDPIVYYVPKSLFMQRGNYLHIGKDYGFYIDSHEIIHNYTGASVPHVNEVDVFIFDLQIFYHNESFTIKVVPLYTYTYFYFAPYMAGFHYKDKPRGVHLSYPHDDDFYYVNMQSEKAFEQGLVAPYPYCDFDPYTTGARTFQCDRDVAKQNITKYAIRNVGSLVNAKNINYSNKKDLEYVEANDIGFSFNKAVFVDNSTPYEEAPETMDNYMITNLVDIVSEDFFDEILDELPLLDKLINIYEFLKNSAEHKNKIDEYLKFMYDPDYDAEYLIQYYNKPNRITDASDNNGLVKSMFYCPNSFDYENTNFRLLFPGIYGAGTNQSSTNYSKYINMDYIGYFPELEENNEIIQNTLIEYNLYMEIVGFNSNTYEYDLKTYGNYLGSETVINTVYKELNLDYLENDTFENGYFLEGYSDLLKFIPNETGVYYFDLDDLYMSINGEEYTGECYINLFEDVEYHIEIYGYANNYRKYSFEVYIQKSFDLLIDPYLENAGSEVLLNNGDLNDSVMHVGYTRNIFLGENAPIELYGSRLDYTWMSSNNSIATVSQYGTVFAKSTGEVTISACISNRYVSEIIIYIYAVDPITGTETFDVALDISEDPNVPNGTMINYTPSELEIQLGYNYGLGGFDMKLGYTRCIFILNGPSSYRKDYTFSTDCTSVSVSAYGTIIINPNISDVITSVTITCTYKYNSSYQRVFTINIHQQEI